MLLVLPNHLHEVYNQIGRKLGKHRACNTHRGPDPHSPMSGLNSIEKDDLNDMKSRVMTVIETAGLGTIISTIINVASTSGSISGFLLAYLVVACIIGALRIFLALVALYYSFQDANKVGAKSQTTTYKSWLYLLTAADVIMGLILVSLSGRAGVAATGNNGTLV